MRTLSRSILPSLLWVLGMVCFSAVKAQMPALHVDGNLIKDECGNKVILRGVSMEHIHDQANSSGGINGLIDLLTNQGDGWYTKLLRLPVDAHVYNENPDHYINTWLTPSVDYATSKGLYVIIDWHYVDDVNVGDHDQKTKEFWHKVAPLYKDYTNVWYELYNEPMMALDWWSLRGYYQAWYDICRQYAPDNIILVGSEFWAQNPQHACDAPVNGTNIAYVMHMYANHHPGLNGNIYNAANCAPVIMTEWGFRGDLGWNSDGAGGETVSTFGQPVMDMMDEAGVHWTAWCASEDYLPAMFYQGWGLRVGENEMGGFIKDALAHRKDWDQPCNATGPYQLIINKEGSGIYSISPEKSEYTKGETVTITTDPANGSVVAFSGLGAGSSISGNTATIKMDGTRNVTISFIAPLSLPARIEAEDYTDMSGIQTEPTEDTGGGENVGYIDAGDWMDYQVNLESGGTYDITFRVAANVAAGGQLRFEVNGESMGTVRIDNTSGWQNWVDVTLTEVYIPAGSSKLAVVAEAEGWNMNYLTLEANQLDDVSTGITKSALFNWYPAIAKDNIFITGYSGSLEGTVHSVTGAQVAMFNSDRIDVAQLTPGVYTARVNNNNQIQSFRFVKQ